MDLYHDQAWLSLINHSQGDVEETASLSWRTETVDVGSMDADQAWLSLINQSQGDVEQTTPSAQSLLLMPVCEASATSAGM
eukprot:232108-Chlamydomonas_euryale.AAC.1